MERTCYQLIAEPPPDAPVQTGTIYVGTLVTRLRSQRLPRDLDRDLQPLVLLKVPGSSERVAVPLTGVKEVPCPPELLDGT